jgi:hypothetical protein
MIDYLALTQDCRTENQFNRVHIDLLTRMTPKELVFLVTESQAGRLPDQVRLWLAPIPRHSPMMLTRPEPYETIRVSETLSWLRSPNPEGRKRNVLVLVCGNLDLPMISMPHFLQAIPADRWDILKVVRPTYPGPRYNKLGLLARVAEFRAKRTGETHRRQMRPGREMADLAAIIDGIKAAVSGVPRERIFVMGQSSGGWVSIYVALALGARRCVVMSGSTSDALLSKAPRWIARSPVKPRDVDFVHTFGAENAKDREAAEQAMAIWGGRLVAFPGIKEHSTLFPLLAQRLFYATLEPLIAGGPLPPEIVAHDLR